ncbi:uncharacterized protein LOC123295001 [Chrysoperla carnea]|uniref:uncharacterized protein LOC123295001 n=1 Tax=Chrysoperla carnea TaxID=189513 RepID=UPI001D07AF4E|nr:uncharacterized protein LOC123295001 [Chrysoperla carnea]
METLIARKIVHQNFNTSIQENCSNFVYDASAKIPSGLLSGNINQFGDFDECINSHSDDGEIAGQYCLVDIQTVEPSSKSDYLLKLNNLINTYYPAHSDFDDAGHIGPRMSSIRWALCVPASCSRQDVEIGLKAGLQSFVEKNGKPLQIKVFDESCQIIENPIPWSAIIVGLLFAVYILFVITVTIIDSYFQYSINDGNDILYAFSLHRNLKSLFSYERSTDDIKSVHGIRFLNMLMIFMSHKTLYGMYSGYVNKADWVEFLISPLSLGGRATILYTDTFLMLSGMLWAYSYFGRINRGKQVHIIEEFISRLARIKQLVNAADYMYVIPTHRITVYLLGILLGYYLRNMKNISLKPIVLNIGHATAIALFSIVFVAPAFTSGKSYKYNPSHPAWYAGYGPIPWCLVWAWIIFTDCFGFHNILTKLLSWRGFLITTRLSYAIYLVQLPILGHNAATNRKKYPKEIQSITTVLNIVNNYGDDERLIKMKEICEKLSLPAEKVTEYLQVTSSSKEDSNSSSRPVINNDIPIKNTSCCKSSLNQDENDCIIKKLEDLIHEIEECEINKNYKLCKNNELKSKYDKFKIYWSDWKEKHIQDIKVWINDLERRSMIMDDPPYFYEALAVLNRAFELCIGHALRLPQILALILFNQKSSDSGLLCQIQTGEGKTYIIAATAILKILLENKNSIDIITSNNVLARHAVSATKNLYQLFNITVDINTEFKSDQKACYNANVVYGSMSDFQFDFLNHDFNGLGTRMNRKFEYVILDEVDNMLIDNGGNIAKLAEIFPGMENLIYIYIEIWKDLNIFINKTFDDINIKPDKELIQCKISEWKNLIQNKIENNIESFLIPLHLMEYVQNVLPKWIDNAIYAKYDCIENIHYVIQTENKDDYEQIIVPVDYTNTGVTLKNTMWSHGLHQFLQLKHNLQVHAENLTSCCISNYAYIRKYGTNLIGLTGTIGGEGEQDLLKAIYQVDFISLPTFKVKQFEKYPEIIVPDIEWLDKIIEQCFYMLLQKRAVLVVCLTIADANDVYNELIQLKSTYIDLNPTIQKYLSENESHVTDEFIDSGTIIVATNIAGRGTDFKTTKQLEDHGGLHICVTFCPESKRVQDQVFYRTSRQGNKGSAGLILSESQVADIMKDDRDYEFHEISQRIHDDELVYMEYLKTFKSKELYFEDCLFNLFSSLYKQARTNKLNVFARKDLKEYWAFWFEKQEFLSITNFEKIENEALELFELFQEDDKIQEILKGHIEHNPYYDIHRAHAYISEQNLAKAEECLNNSLEMTNDTLSEAHYLLFEVSMERGGVVMNQIKDILTNVGLGYLIKMNKDSEYKNKCMEHLEKARSILIKEIQFIENYFNCDEFYKTFNGSLDKNLFIKHLHSKLICLKMFHENINQIHYTIQKNGDKDLMITMKNDDIQTVLESEPETVKTIKKDFINKEETNNLSLRGLKCLFNVGEIKTVPKEVFIASGLQIALGCAALGLGWFFPFIMEYAQTIAATLIAEGILDIIICLIGGKIAFDWNYFKSKLITFGITAVSLGITALGGYINKLISKARSFLKMDNLMSLIKMVPGVDSIMNGIGNVLQKAQSFINLANKNFIPNGILSKPLLNTLWQACNKVGRFLIVSNIIDTNIQNRFLKGWETLYEAIKGIVSTDFIGKLNTTILTILSCKKGYDLLMSKLGSLNVGDDGDFDGSD